MRRLPPHGKEKCGSPRVTLRLHHLKEKKEKSKNAPAPIDHDSYENSANMESGKPGGEDVVTTKEGTEESEGGEGKENVGESGGNGEGQEPESAPVKRTHSTEEEEDTRKKRRKDDAPSRGKSGSNSGGSPKSAVGGESENEDNKSVESPGPKVPPLKIVIPGASLEEQGTRNGKNGTARHHQALPYVVSSTEGSEGSSPPPPAASAPPAQPQEPEPAPQPAPVTVPEDQRTHQRVLRSHRSGNGGGNSSGASGNPSPVGGAEAVSPRQVSPTPGADAPATAEMAGGGEDKPAEEAQQQPALSASTGTASATAATPGNGANGNNGAGAGQAGGNGGGNGNAGTSPATGNGAATPAQPNVELHPRKRKLKPKEQPLPQETHPEPPASQTAEQQVTNCYQLFLNIRKQIDRRRKGLFPVQPKPPQGFKDYLMNRCTYVLAGNTNSRVPPPHATPPPTLNTGMRDIFVVQEKERYRLRMQHVIEKEKLVLSVEQEILRVHGRAARALANQALPFSACTILRDEEVYSPFTPEQEEKDRNARSRYNGRLFLSWLQDVDDKWEKIKEAMLLRHHNEAESLHAVQKMDWEWKMKELGICESKAKPVIDDSHVPMVHVSDDFDLLPA